MASLIPWINQQFTDDAGAALASGLVYTYAAGTTTPKATYTTYAGDVENANPVVLDSAGRAAIWMGSGGYKFVVKTSAGVTVRTDDNVFTSGSGSGGISVVATMTALRALAENAASVVYVRGFYADEDGGGGWFYWDSASTASEDYGVVIVPDSAPATGRWVRYFEGRDLSVRWFGAKGDTTTNDTTAITRCDDYLYSSGIGGAVLFPAGTYLMSSDPTFTCDIKLLDNAVLKWSGYNLDLSYLVTAPEANQCFDCVADDLPTLPYGIKILPIWFGATGDGSTDDTAAIGKALAAVPAENGGGSVYIKGGTYIIDGTAELLNILSNTELHGDGDATILQFDTDKGDTEGMLQITSKANISIHDIKLDGDRTNQSTAQQGNGIKIVTYGTAIRIKNVTFVNMYEYAICCDCVDTTELTKSQFEDNYIYDCAAGIYIDEADLLVSVKNNDIFMDEADDGAANYPILINNSSNIRVDGNRIELESGGTSSCAAITETGTNTAMEYGFNQIINYTTTITTTATRNIEADLNLKCLKRLVTAKGTDVASAGNLVLAANGNVFDITGTTTINGISITDWTEGSEITLQFDGALILSHDATVVDPYYKLAMYWDSSYTTAAGEVIKFVLAGSVWRQINSTHSHLAKNGGSVASANHVTIPQCSFCYITGTTEIDMIATAGWYSGAVFVAAFSGIVTVKHASTPDSGYATIHSSTGSHITTAAYSMILFVYDAANTCWRAGLFTV